MRTSDSIYDERWPMQDVLLPYAYRLSVYGSCNRFIVRRGSITGRTNWWPSHKELVLTISTNSSCREVLLRDFKHAIVRLPGEQSVSCIMS
jgi:hypothetical protein